MFFIPYSVGRQQNPLVLVPKKSIALQLRWQLSAGVMPILGRSGISVTASSAGQTLPTVALVPSVGWTDVGAQGTPLEVTGQLAMVAIPLPMIGQMGLPTAVGAT